MVRKSIFILVITISIVMSYGGCDGDGGGIMDEAPPGAEAPAASAQCNLCPCEFFDIQITEECWGNPDILDTPIFDSSLTTQGGPGMCTLFAVLQGNTTVALSVDVNNQNQWRCGYDVPADDRCGEVETNAMASTFKSLVLEIDEDIAMRGCIPCLEQYTTARESLGPVRIVGDNNPNDPTDLSPHCIRLPGR